VEAIRPALVIRVLPAALLLAVVLALVPAAPASARPRMCFYAQERNVTAGALTGHAFVQLLPDSGPQAGRRDLVYGFYPAVQWRFIIGSPGKIPSDASHAWDWKLCQSVNANEYNDAEKLVAADIASPPEYVFFKFNCTDWVFKVARTAGVTLPSAGALGTGVYDPEVLAKKFQAMWVQQGGRNIPGGNAVFKNTNGSTPANSSDHRVNASGEQPPAASEELHADSYSDIARLAFSDPDELGRGLDMGADSETLPSAVVGRDGRLRVSIQRIDTRNALTAVRFGDGAVAYQGERFDHTYRRPGRYRVTGIAVAQDSVYRFSFPVRVDPRGDGDAEQRAALPDLRPHPDQFPLLTDPVVPLPE
jgi:hypothetical protein